MKTEGGKQGAAGGRAWLVCALLLALRATGVASAQTATTSGSTYRLAPGSMQPGLTVTVRVYNYARIATGLLFRSEGEAAVIFRQAGVETIWVDCPLSEPELYRFQACQEPMGRADFVLRIRSSVMTPLAAAHDDALGSALACLPDGIGCSAEVFYQRVADWASGGDIAAYQLLGHAMAHEIGHLLLGPDSHSQTGLMRAAWDPKEIKLMARGYLPFTAKQRRRLRVEVFHRAERGKLYHAIPLRSAGGRTRPPTAGRRGRVLSLGVLPRRTCPPDSTLPSGPIFPISDARRPQKVMRALRLYR